ncbi:NB-ARC domain-containing protein [Protofrankia coriariae]|uniref:NB-ARC domain-containing protein n=1 Tax=Protofrankia coriariae TaxID=1562887 RepID=UPI0012F6B538|nr:NB-ARC domain-containing protein [Protofrankia coriariae]
MIRRTEVASVVAAVCSRQGGTVGITTVLTGAGGFGKTTLAKVVCADKKVRKHFKNRVYFVTMGRDERSRASIASKVNQVIHLITGDTTTFDDPELAGARLGGLLDQRPRILLVLDDIWEREQLDPFLRGGSRCVRLVTTRVPTILPTGSGAPPVLVDRMSHAEARQVLTWRLPRLPEVLTWDLLATTGRWPLLLHLTNGIIKDQVDTGADATAVAEETLRQLRAQGPAAVDDPLTPPDPDDANKLNDPNERGKAVRATVEAAARLLLADGRDRFVELGIFAANETVPVTLVARLWEATGAYTERQSRALCLKLDSLSLLTLKHEAGGSVTLHDVIRDYLRGELGPARLTALNEALVDAVEAGLPAAEPLAPSAPRPPAAWWKLTDGYLLDHAIDHLLAAGRTDQAEALASDLRWVETRLCQRGPTSPWRDLSRIPTPTAAERARDLARTAHLLGPTQPTHALSAILYSRIEPLAHWHDQVTVRQGRSGQPALLNRWTPPDIPDPAILRPLAGHTGRVTALAIAPDGTWLATGSYDDATVRIWDRSTGRITTTLTSQVTVLAIAPDGTWLATGSRDGTVHIWNPTTGTLTSTLASRTGSVLELAIAPDGTWLAAVGNDGTICIWDPITATLLHTITDQTDAATALAIAPDSRWLATGSHDGTIRIWDSATATLLHTLTGHTAWITALAITPDGTWLATSSHDGTIRIWDSATGRATATLTGHTAWVITLAIAPDGSWLASGSDDRTVRIWDPASSALLHTLTGHTHEVTALAITPDGTWLATTGSYDEGTVRIWDPATGRATGTLTGHTAAATKLAIAPDGSWLATAGSFGDGTVRIWDPAAATLTSRTSPAGDVTAVTIAPDGTWLAAIHYSGAVRLRDRATGRLTATLSTGAQVTAIAPDGTWLVVGDSLGTVAILDRATGHPTAVLTGGTGWVTAVAIAPDGTWLATGSLDGEVRLWDRVTGLCTATLIGHTGRVTMLAIAPDNSLIATSGEDGTARIWNLATGNPVPTRTRRAPRTSRTSRTRWTTMLAIAPDGAWLATGSHDGVIRIWDPATSRVITTLTGHTGNVTAMTIAPDGTWLATGSDDGSIGIWNRAAGRIGTPIGHTGQVTALAISPDSTRLATAGHDGDILILDGASGDAVTMMRADGRLHACVWTPDGHGLAVGGERGAYFYGFRS